MIPPSSAARRPRHSPVGGLVGRGSPRSQLAENSSDYLSDLSTQLTGFNSLLRQLGANDGLTYYDKSDQLEVLLKNVVNALKDALESSSILVYRVPLLGQTLGPCK